MTNTRRVHNAEFKAKVALEAMSSMQTIEEIASKYGVHPMMVSKWKKRLQENALEVFEKEGKHTKEMKEQEEKIEKLYQTIGQREYELSWLKKNMGIKT